jgi:hypothetical protein
VDELDFKIDQALNHKSRHKNDDLEIYVDGWLDREMKKYSARVNPNGKTKPEPGTMSKEEYYNYVMGIKK